MPAAGETLTARDLVLKLGAFLAELTSNRLAVAVHADILRQLSEPDHDPRLAETADAEQFAAVWMTLRLGSPPPPDAWQRVVLPTVVALSGPNDLKSHLELATSLWMRAIKAINGPAQATTVADDQAILEPDPEPEPEPVGSTASSASWEWAPPPVAARAVKGSPHRRRRVVVAATVAAALIASAVVWWTQAHRQGQDNLLPDVGAPAVAGPAAGPQATPTAQPAGTTPTPLTTQPVPAPTWTGPGPIVEPTPPQNLAVIGATATTIALSWQPPAEAGSGGIAYYRIRRDGIDSGWTAQTSATVTGLTPATGYSFTIVAYNGAGAASAPSSPVTATTSSSAAPPPPSPQSPPQTGPPPGNPLLATEPPQRPINLGRDFTLTGSGWPCSAPSTIHLSLGGKLIATPKVSADGTFRTTITVDASQPNAPTVAVIGSAEPLTLTRGLWLLTARLPAQPSCTAVADQSLQIEFRTGPGN